jgi:hypothetical protein
MSVQTYVCRLFGGRDTGVTYDNVGQTLTILGQSLSISTLPTSLQAQLQAALGGASSGIVTAGASFSGRPAFGGDNITSAVGAILDNQPNWRNAVTAALATFVGEQTSSGLAPDVASWNR